MGRFPKTGTPGILKISKRKATMKRIISVLAVLALLTSSAFAGSVFTTLTIDWFNAISGFDSNPSSADYNWTTDHFLVCDYNNVSPAETKVRIASNTDGALTGATLSKTGATNLGTLGFFSICVADDGAIYAGSNEFTTGVGDIHLYRWANESADCTTQMPGTLPDPPNADIKIIFPRTMDAYGSGVDTLIAVAGDDTYRATILGTTDGVTFSVVDITPAYSAEVGNLTRIKQSVDIVSPTKIYGTQADGGYYVAALNKVNDVWQPLTTFAPPTAASMGNPSAIGYIEGYNVVCLLGTSATGTATPPTVPNATEWLTVLGGTYGNQIQQIECGQNVGTYGYGFFEFDAEAGVGYFGSRSAITAAPYAYHLGKISFEPYEAPTQATTSWGLYE